MNPNANVDLSDTVMLFARKYQIASWFDLKPIPRDPRWKELMTLHLSSRHAFSVNHAPFFSYFEQPLTHKYLARYVPMKSIPLWIWVHVFAMADGCPAIVRSGCTRKITAAVRSALRKNGYDRHGWASDGSGKVLQGTLKVNAYKTKDIMKLPFPELVGFFSRTVQKTLIPRLSKPVFYKVK
ncbi:hypothetical protein QBC35DRAFT_380744 [Podospora australis]|uniref:Uncharacterized protein n=1 Tax=Podospora australis TaxID=1536484 RepID=A0AAN6WVZ0_9PEZI|nr:hypothetical protein QBC35DRAFT_380744 [Podospora australis]